MFVPLRRRDFEYTDALAAVSIWTSVAPSIAALAANLFVLACAAAIYCNRKTRRLLSRQSLIMLLSVQLVGVLYDVAYIVEELLTGPTDWCDASVSLGFLANNYVNFVVTLIAVNLQLSVVYGVNTVNWTKYYIGCSFLASFAIMIPGAANDVWGWDPIGEECWTHLQDPNERFIWQMMTGYIWAILGGVVSLVATTHVLLRLLAGRKRTRQLFTGSRSTNLVLDDHLVRRVAMRIVWYPIILIVSNALQIAGELTENKDGSIDNMTAYTLFVIDGMAFALTPLLLAIVAIFVDPTFAKAVRMLVLHATPSAPSSGDSRGDAGAGVGSTVVFTPAVTPSEAGTIGLDIVKMPTARDRDGETRRTDEDAGADDEPCGARKSTVHAMPGFEIMSAPASLGTGATMGTAIPPPLQDRLRARAAAHRVNLDAL